MRGLLDRIRKAMDLSWSAVGISISPTFKMGYHKAAVLSHAVGVLSLLAE